MTCPLGTAIVGHSLYHLHCRLILDARNLGKTFTDIAKMLPARNVTALRKHYTIMSKPKVCLMCLHWLQSDAVPHCIFSWLQRCSCRLVQFVCASCNVVFTLQALPIKKPSPPLSADSSPVAPATASFQSVAAAASASAASVRATALETLNAASRQPSPAASKASPAPSETVEIDYRWAL